MSIIVESKKHKLEASYDPTKTIIKTVYIFSPTYVAYKRLLDKVEDPSMYRYIYDAAHLKKVCKNTPPSVKIEMLLLEEWHRHPDAANIMTFCINKVPYLLG